MPFVDEVHADQFLSSISLLQTNEGYVGNTVWTPAPTDKRSNKYRIFGNEHFKVGETIRRPGSDATEVKFTTTSGQFTVQEYAKKTIVPAQTEKNADAPAFDPEVDATIQLTELMMLDREKRQMTVAADAAQITQNATLAGTTQWSDYVNSTPLTNVKTARQTVRSGVHREANTWTMSYDVALTLADHPSFKDLIKFTDPNALAVGGLPPTVRGLKINVSQVDWDNTGYLQATPVYAPVFSKASLIHYTNPSIGLRTITLGTTMEMPDPITGARGMSTRRWQDDGKKGVWVETADTYVVVVLAPLAAYLHIAAIA